MASTRKEPVLLFLLATVVMTMLTAGMKESEILRYRERARKMFQHGYDNYMRHAYPLDELKPLSCSGYNTWGSFSLTLVDAMDTLLVMGNVSEFGKAYQKVLKNLDFDVDYNASVFESNIRVLGGLLSSHLLMYRSDVPLEPGWPCSGPLLRLATDLADRLLPAFNTSTGMPYGTVNLKYGVPPGETPVTCVAGIGTFIVEFGTLSRLTGDQRYEEAALAALSALWKRRSSIGLVPSHINTASGAWATRLAGIGGGIDSYFEYLLKGGVLFRNKHLVEMFSEFYEAIQEHLMKNHWYVGVDVEKGVMTHPHFQSLDAFFPGLQTMVGDIQDAAATARNYHLVWRRYGAIPEIFNIGTGKPLDGRESYPLRPELIESAMYLHRATSDPYWLELGRDMLEAIERIARVACGYTTVKNVLTHDLEDRMESFFLSETVKYLYLLFDKDNFLMSNGADGRGNGPPEVASRLPHWTKVDPSCHIGAGGYIFNTEAHPINVGAMACCYSQQKNGHWGKPAQSAESADWTYGADAFNGIGGDPVERIPDDKPVGESLTLDEGSNTSDEGDVDGVIGKSVDSSEAITIERTPGEMKLKSAVESVLSNNHGNDRKDGDHLSFQNGNSGLSSPLHEPSSHRITAATPGTASAQASSSVSPSSVVSGDQLLNQNLATLEKWATSLLAELGATKEGELVSGDFASVGNVLQGSGVSGQIQKDLMLAEQLDQPLNNELNMLVGNFLKVPQQPAAGGEAQQIIGGTNAETDKFLRQLQLNIQSVLVQATESHLTNAVAANSGQSIPKDVGSSGDHSQPMAPKLNAGAEAAKLFSDGTGFPGNFSCWTPPFTHRFELYGAIVLQPEDKKKAPVKEHKPDYESEEHPKQAKNGGEGQSESDGQQSDEKQMNNKEHVSGCEGEECKASPAVSENVSAEETARAEREDGNNDHQARGKHEDSTVHIDQSVENVHTHENAAEQSLNGDSSDGTPIVMKANKERDMQINKQGKFDQIVSQSDLCVKTDAVGQHFVEPDMVIEGNSGHSVDVESTHPAQFQASGILCREEEEDRLKSALGADVDSQNVDSEDQLSESGDVPTDDVHIANHLSMADMGHQETDELLRTHSVSDDFPGMNERQYEQNTVEPVGTPGDTAERVTWPEHGSEGGSCSGQSCATTPAVGTCGTDGLSCTEKSGDHSEGAFYAGESSHDPET